MHIASIILPVIYSNTTLLFHAQVQPVSTLPGDVSPYCPRMLINREPALVLSTGNGARLAHANGDLLTLLCMSQI